MQQWWLVRHHLTNFYFANCRQKINALKIVRRHLPILNNILPCLVKQAHILDIGGGETPQPGQFLLKLRRDSLYGIGSPCAGAAVIRDVFTDTEIEHQHLAIDQHRRIVSTFKDRLFDGLYRLRVVMDKDSK